MRKQLAALALMPALILGCSDDDKPAKPKSKSAASWLEQVFTQSNPSAVLTVQGLEGEVIANAQVLIGDRPGSIENNLVKTNELGVFEAPSSWTGAESLTVQAPGYLRLTILGAEPKARTIRLRKAPTQAKIELSGVTQGHPVADRDGLVDFGLVIPALTRTDFLAFDINTLISPQIDIITAIGQEIKIPSNVSLPKQTESYIFPITLDKARYRIYFGEKGAVERVFAARGRFPFKSVVNQLRGGAQFHELINEFSIFGGGVRDVELKDVSNKLDIPIRELNFSEKRNVIGLDTGKDELAISVGIAHQNGYLIPTDLKRTSAKGTTTLNVLPQSETSLLTILKRTTEMEGGKPGADRLSASILPFEEKLKPTNLPLMANPVVFAGSVLQVPRVSTLPGVNPIATYSIVSQLTEKTLDGKKVVELNPQWEIYGDRWVDNIKLPQFPQPLPAGKKRWQVTLLGSQTTSQVELDPSMVDQTTHITNSSIDF